MWWFKFYFAGQLIRETSKSTSRTVAKEAERERRRELEAGYNNVKEVRRNRIRLLAEIIDDYLVGYRLRYQSASFAEYALGHVSRLLGAKLGADINEVAVLGYQNARLGEGAAPKSINEEVRFLLKMLGDPGEVLRAHLKKEKQLKLRVHKTIGKAFDSDESESLETKAKISRSPHMYPAYMLARNGGLRDTEIKTLAWSPPFSPAWSSNSFARLASATRACGASARRLRISSGRRIGPMSMVRASSRTRRPKLLANSRVT
ncbi:MAG: hypothetical protein ACRD28_09545 [Acidobacteriaceae bacterium]